MSTPKEYPGFRVEFAEDDFFGQNCVQYTGMGNVVNALKCDCPNCGNVMYPAMNFTSLDPNFCSSVNWKRSSLRILFCPFCALYMEPYWIRHNAQEIEIVGGYRDGGEVLQNIETPYLSREIMLTPLAAEDYPTDEEILNNLLERRRPPGVYHQLGGMPIKGRNERLECCDCSQEMRFAGILDYDDLNVPLYEEDHSPVALIIGDYDSINFYLCGTCSVIGLKWAK